MKVLYAKLTLVAVVHAIGWVCFFNTSSSYVAAIVGVCLMGSLLTTYKAVCADLAKIRLRQQVMEVVYHMIDGVLRPYQLVLAKDCEVHVPLT